MRSKSNQKQFVEVIRIKCRAQVCHNVRRCAFTFILVAGMAWMHLATSDKLEGVWPVFSITEAVSSGCHRS